VGQKGACKILDIMQAWVYLSAAILLEVAGTTSMKLSQGFTRTLPSVLIFVFYALSFVALTLALKRLELSVAYVIWAGVGTALTTITLAFCIFRSRPRFARRRALV
jgi:small multidrug resistance pump